MQPTPDELKEIWNYNLSAKHQLTEEGKRNIGAIRSAAKAMMEAIVNLTPAGRDQALALTSLEQMTFYANAAIARGLNESKQPPADKPAPTPTREVGTESAPTTGDKPKEQ